MLEIRNMVLGDVDPAIKLTDTVDWGFVRDDFEFMMGLEPEGCFVAVDDARFVGLTTTVSFESLGWIGNVIVEVDYRNRGVGSLLVRNAMNYLERRGVRTVGLYSYVGTVPFYEGLGFRRDETFVYLVGSGVACGENKAVRPMEDGDLNKVIELDRRCIGVSRERLLRSVFERSRNLCHVAEEGGGLVGFVMARESQETAEVGPLICRPGPEGRALSLLNALLRKFIGSGVYIGVPEKKVEMLSTLRGLGFRENFKVVRMYYGKTSRDKGCLFAIESLERG